MIWDDDSGGLTPAALEEAQPMVALWQRTAHGHCAFEGPDRL